MLAYEQISLSCLLGSFAVGIVTTQGDDTHLSPFPENSDNNHASDSHFENMGIMGTTSMADLYVCVLWYRHVRVRALQSTFGAEVCHTM